jgi:hypothetical protein
MINSILMAFSLMTPGATVPQLVNSEVKPLMRCRAVRAGILEHYGESVELAHTVIQETHMRVYFRLTEEQYSGVYMVLILWPKGHVSIPDQLLKHITAGQCTVKDGKKVHARLDIVIPHNIPRKAGGE